MDYNFNDVFHCILLFNHQHEPILSMYDDYFLKTVINTYRDRCTDNVEFRISIPNILMQVFSPILASQAAMLENMKMRFTRITLANDNVLIIHRVQYCSLVILLSESCLYRHHASIIARKLDMVEWLISGFYGICWNHIKFTTDKWLKVLLKELWLMDFMEFNLYFWSIERLNLNNSQRFTERVYDVLVSNSKYMKQLEKRHIKHQLILAGSKLYTLYSTDVSNTLKAKNLLLFVIICNTIFNRFSRARDALNNVGVSNSFYTESSSSSLTTRVQSSPDATSISDSFSSGGSSNITTESQTNELSRTLQLAKSLRGKVNSNSSTTCLSELDPFVLWVENKDGYKYRIVRIFLSFSHRAFVPCNLHLIKLARNVIYVGVEEDLDNNSFISNLDKSIRLLRRIIADQNQRKDTVPILKGRISQAIEKLVHLGIVYSAKIRQIFSQILKELSNYEVLERLLKELLRNLELVYVQYYLSSPIQINDRLCKVFLRCFLAVRREMSDFVSMLSVQALRNLPATSLGPLYPGLVHFVLVVRQQEHYLVAPVLEWTASEEAVGRLQLTVALCRRLANHTAEAPGPAWRQVEMVRGPYRCTYLRRRIRTIEERLTELELVTVHESDIPVLTARRQIPGLVRQFLEELNYIDLGLTL